MQGWGRPVTEVPTLTASQLTALALLRTVSVERMDWPDGSVRLVKVPHVLAVCPGGRSPVQWRRTLPALARRGLVGVVPDGRHELVVTLLPDGLTYPLPEEYAKPKRPPKPRAPRKVTEAEAEADAARSDIELHLSRWPCGGCLLPDDPAALYRGVTLSVTVWYERRGRPAHRRTEVENGETYRVEPVSEFVEFRDRWLDLVGAVPGGYRREDIWWGRRTKYPLCPLLGLLSLPDRALRVSDWSRVAVQVPDYEQERPMVEGATRVVFEFDSYGGEWREHHDLEYFGFPEDLEQLSAAVAEVVANGRAQEVIHPDPLVLAILRHGGAPMLSAGRSRRLVVGRALYASASAAVPNVSS